LTLDVIYILILIILNKILKHKNESTFFSLKKLKREQKIIKLFIL